MVLLGSRIELRRSDVFPLMTAEMEGRIGERCVSFDKNE